MFLEKILRTRRERLAAVKKNRPFPEVRREAEEAARMSRPPSLSRALQAAAAKGKAGVIAEIKKASPSKGLIREQFDPVTIALAYEKAGAAAISVLTEEDYFLGSPLYLQEVSRAVRLPLLRKDFIFDPYQIYEARLLGAAAVLLIAAVLEQEEIEELAAIATELGMEALVEVHDEEEAEKVLAAGVRLVGVNNRNLHTFVTDLNTSFTLAPLLRKAGVVMVSESGINTAAEIQELSRCGYHGVLIGEALMRAPDPGAALEVLLTT